MNECYYCNSSNTQPHQPNPKEPADIYCLDCGRVTPNKDKMQEWLLCRARDEAEWQKLRRT